MPEDIHSRIRRVLEQQLAMNAATWEALQSHGVTEASPLRLDFSFVADDLNAAEALKAFLESETDYEVGVGTDDGHTWIVAGSTQPTAVSLPILDQWVDWMVTTGASKHCDFDGWGTTV